MSKGVYKMSAGKRVYTSSINDSKYSTAAIWIQAYILEEPVCNTCSGNTDVSSEDQLSLEEMATFIQGSGIPDTLTGPGSTARDSRP